MKLSLMQKQINNFIKQSGGIEKAIQIIQTRIDRPLPHQNKKEL